MPPTLYVKICPGPQGQGQTSPGKAKIRSVTSTGYSILYESVTTCPLRLVHLQNIINVKDAVERYILQVGARRKQRYNKYNTGERERNFTEIVMLAREYYVTVISLSCLV